MKTWTKHPKHWSLLGLSLLFLAPALWSCTAAAPINGADQPADTQTQYGPVERPPVVAEAGPQKTACPYDCMYLANENPKETPECQEIYANPEYHCRSEMYRYEPPPPPEIPQRVIQTVDCSPFFVEGDGYHPENVGGLCRQAYTDWWNSNHGDSEILNTQYQLRDFEPKNNLPIEAIQFNRP